MSDKKETIKPEEIEAKNVDRRKFIMGATGAVIASSVATISGCGGGGSDSCDTNIADPAFFDNDPFDPIRADNNVTDPCDSD